jgi:signal transduction histidine kinase
MPSPQQVLADLIHDMAQPLSAIETGAFCLDLHIDPQNARAQEYLRMILQQAERASSLLAAAAAELRQSREQHAEAYHMAGVSY